MADDFTLGSGGGVRSYGNTADHLVRKYSSARSRFWSLPFAVEAYGDGGSRMAFPYGDTGVAQLLYPDTASATSALQVHDADQSSRVSLSGSVLNIDDSLGDDLFIRRNGILKVSDE